MSEYTDEVRAAFAKVARFMAPNEPEPNTALKVLIFVRGLATGHDEYKTAFHDRRRTDQQTPKTIDDTKEDLFEFERDRAIIGQSGFKKKKPEQLAIHGNTQQSEDPPKDPPADARKKGREARPTDKCNHCKEPWHFKRDCPKLKKPANVGSITVVQDVAVLVNRVQQLKIPMWVSLDSGAETSVFSNASLLTNLHQGDPVTVKTVAGKKTIKTWGYFGPIKVLFDPTAEANLLSQHDLELASEQVTFVPCVSWTSTLSVDGTELEFSKPELDEFGKTNKFYSFIPEVARVGSVTTTDREKLFAKSEVERAKGVHALKLRLGVPPTSMSFVSCVMAWRWGARTLQPTSAEQL